MSSETTLNGQGQSTPSWEKVWPAKLNQVGRSGSSKIEFSPDTQYGTMSSEVVEGVFSAIDHPTDMYNLSTDSVDPPRDFKMVCQPVQWPEQ